MTHDSAELAAHIQRNLALALDDDQLRELIPDSAIEAAAASTTSYADAITLVLEGYGPRPALGSRGYDVVVDAETGRSVRRYRPEFETITYAQLRERVTALASVFRQRFEDRVEPGDFVCALGFTGADFVTVEFACALAQGVIVPLQTAMGRSGLVGVFANTAPVVVASTVADLPLVAELVAAQESVRTLIVFDFDERVDDEREAVKTAEALLAERAAATRLVTLAELIADGTSLAWAAPAPRPDSLDQMALLLHSSGTTGTPKGAIHSERIVKRYFRPESIPVPTVRLVFSPMAHSQGRGAVYMALAHGGTVAFITTPDLSTLLEDLALVRPTNIRAFPRALEMVYRQYQAEVARGVIEGNADREAVRSAVLTGMRERVFGDRICTINVAGAATAPEVKRFIAEDLGIELSNGLGSTEFGGCTMNERVIRPEVIDYRLRDVPELGYYTSDKPYPRGELCIKGRLMISGYYKSPEASAKLFDADGFGLTGDIVEERGSDHLVYIGRRNDVTKLAQGEYVALGALATTFENGSEVISQIFLYGYAARPYLLAVVVPNLELARLSVGHEPSEADLRRLIRAELQRVAVSAALKSFEVPRDFIVELEPFTQENGLLTGIRKVKRGAIQARYGPRLETLYAELDQRQQDELTALRGSSGSLTVLDKIGRALSASLSIDEIDVESPASFAELGGDSLAAPAFAALLEDIFGVELPINAILSPAGNPKHWAHLIETALRDDSWTTASFAKVHGKGARQLDAEDLRLEAFIDGRVLDNAATEAPAATPHAVLLTGATGFLGRFLCLEWLERLAPIGGQLICLVRATDQAAARRRLDACFTTTEELDTRYTELARSTLEVVVGDIAEVGLGVDEAEFGRLAREVDRIVHPAAMVNHVLDYEFLFDPNVAGTAALIGLALSERQKPIDFVSSGAVSPFLDPSGGLDEDSPLLATVQLSDHYANGYGASKWAGEHLLQTAHRRFGLPVNVFRGDMMLPHRRFAEQINVEDAFTRLLYSVIVTELAPTSFYTLQPDGSRSRAHYDGLPVDFVAGAITALSTSAQDGLRTFNVTNHADDGLSLDVFVDWIAAAGYPVERVDDYAEWFTRFEAKLRALPEDKRPHSSLHLLGSRRTRSEPEPRVRGGRHFDAALQTIELGPGTPALSQDYITKCLNDMMRLGLIPIPDDNGA